MSVKKQKKVGQLRAELLTGLADLDKPLEERNQENNLTIEEVRSQKFKKPKKIKRSYMLREDTIEKITDMKRIFKNDDYSDIVAKAIDELYEKHKEEVKESFNV